MISFCFHVAINFYYEFNQHAPWPCLIIVVLPLQITVIGNTLVILSVLTTRRLRTVTNCFVMSLAVADWLVGIFVMPPAVALMLVGKLSCFIKTHLNGKIQIGFDRIQLVDHECRRNVNAFAWESYIWIMFTPFIRSNYSMSDKQRCR